MTIAGLLIPAATILTMSAVSCLTEAGQAGISNPGPHGLSEILYGFASGVGNNGSAFAGLGANSLWYSVLIGLAMLIGRYCACFGHCRQYGNQKNRSCQCRYF